MILSRGGICAAGAHEAKHWLVLCAGRGSAVPCVPRDYIQVLGSTALALSRKISDAMNFDDGTVILGQWWPCVTKHFRCCFALMDMRLSCSAELYDALMGSSNNFPQYLHCQLRALSVSGTDQVKLGYWIKFRWNSKFKRFFRGKRSHGSFMLPLMSEKHVDDWLPRRSLKFASARFVLMLNEYGCTPFWLHQASTLSMWNRPSVLMLNWNFSAWLDYILTLCVVSWQLWFSTGWSEGCTP